MLYAPWIDYLTNMTVFSTHFSYNMNKLYILNDSWQRDRVILFLNWLYCLFRKHADNYQVLNATGPVFITGVIAEYNATGMGKKKRNSVSVLKSRSYQLMTYR